MVTNTHPPEERSRVAVVGTTPTVLVLSVIAAVSCDPLTEPGASRTGFSVAGDPAEDAEFAVDVSYWSGHLSDAEVACWADNGVTHVVVGTQDPTAATQQLTTALEGGMTLDAYVLLNWNLDMAVQVTSALELIEPFPVGRVWLDVELPLGGFSSAQVIGKIQEAEEACASFPCGIYTRKVWWRDNLGDTQQFSHLPIWYAYYDGQHGFDDWYDPGAWYEGPFGGWSDPTGKQYDSDWTAPDLCGVNVDYNVMHVEAATAPELPVEAGAVTVNQPDGSTWHGVSLTGSFTNPVVIMGPPSFNGGHPTTVRLRNVSPTGFEFQLDEWDYLDGGHTTETLSYLVVEAGVHQLAGGGRLEAGTLSADHTFRAHAYAEAFAATPVVLSTVQTFNWGSAVVACQRDVTTGGFEVRVQEEEGNDGAHAVETVGYVAVEPGSGSIGERAYYATRTPDAVTNSWYGLSFGGFSEPGLLAGIQTFDGGDPVSIRYRNLGAAGVEFFLEEEKSLDAEIGHTTEAVGVLVLEAGTSGGGDPPADLTGLSPDDDEQITGSSVTLSLNPVSGASTYEFEIEYQSGGVWRPYYIYSATGSSKTFWPVYDDTRYRWRVRAQTAAGWVGPSEWAMFRFGNVGGSSPPPAPTGLSPDNGVTITTSSVTMSCDPISGATGYEFEIEYLSGGVWRTYYTYSADTSSRTFWPVYSTSYRWRVRAQNEHGWGAWSSWASFQF